MKSSSGDRDPAPKIKMCQARIYMGFNVRVSCNLPAGHKTACESWSR